MFGLRLRVCGENPQPIGRSVPVSLRTAHAIEAAPLRVAGGAVGMVPRGQSADAVEGITSFLEKRPASFPDRVSEGLPEIMPWWSEPEFE